MTALTSLLVLATLFTQVSASLPKTSYLKMVDIWLLFCIISIFIIIIFHTIIDTQIKYLNNHSNERMVTIVSPINKEKEQESLHFIKNCYEKFIELENLISVARWSVLSGIILFNLIYWGILFQSSGLTHEYWTLIESLKNANISLGAITQLY